MKWRADWSEETADFRSPEPRIFLQIVERRDGNVEERGRLPKIVAEIGNGSFLTTAVSSVDHGLARIFVSLLRGTGR